MPRRLSPVRLLVLNIKRPGMCYKRYNLRVRGRKKKTLLLPLRGKPIMAVISLKEHVLLKYMLHPCGKAIYLKLVKNVSKRLVLPDGLVLTPTHRTRFLRG